MPEVPTIHESDVPGFELTTWTGMCAPIVVVTTIVTTLVAETVKRTKVLAFFAVRLKK